MWRMWLYYTLKIFVDTCRMIWWYTMTDSHMIIYDDTWCSWSHPHTVCWRPWQKITHTCWIHFDADIWVVVLHCFPRWRASMTELSSEESLFVTRAIWGHKPVNQIVSLVVSSTVTHNAIPQPMISIDFHWFPMAAHDSPILWTRGESFWEVAPDLADSPAAAWAMSLAFPPELKPLFVECFGVREARYGTVPEGGWPGKDQWESRPHDVKIIMMMMIIIQWINTAWINIWRDSTGDLSLSVMIWHIFGPVFDSLCTRPVEVVDTAGLREGILARVNHGKRGGISRQGSCEIGDVQ